LSGTVKFQYMVVQSIKVLQQSRIITDIKEDISFTYSYGTQL